LALLDSVDAKLFRADAQARSIADDVAAWVAGKPVLTNMERREDDLGIRLIVDGFKPELPAMELGLRVGECIHNLRSALDNLAYALARLRQDPPANPRRISFPIYLDQREFERSTRSTLSQLPDEAADLIIRIQPFQRGGSAGGSGEPDQDALVLLQSLNNADKHRMPSVVVIAPTQIEFKGNVTFQSEEDADKNVPPDTVVWGGDIVPGVTLLEYRTKHAIASAKVSLEFSGQVALRIGERTEPIANALSLLAYYTTLVVQQFRPFFQ
jgi:hypothetical protein